MSTAIKESSFLFPARKWLPFRDHGRSRFHEGKANQISPHCSASNPSRRSFSRTCASSTVAIDFIKKRTFISGKRPCLTKYQSKGYCICSISFITFASFTDTIWLLTTYLYPANTKKGITCVMIHMMISLVSLCPQPTGLCLISSHCNPNLCTAPQSKY